MGKFHRHPSVYVSHVAIKVVNLQRSLEFYQQMIGFQVLSQTERQVVLSADGKIGLVTLIQPEDVVSKPERTTGLYHFALLLPTRSDLGSFLSHIVAKKYPIGASDHYVSEAIYLNDPDGNGIEIYRDRPAENWTWEDGHVNMATVSLDGAGLLQESSDVWRGLPEGTLMGHIHLHVNDLEKAETFYTEGLGFNVVSYYPQAAFLSSQGYHHHIAINTWQGRGAAKPPENSVGLSSYTIVYPDEQVLQGVIEKLTALGVPSTKDGVDFWVKDPSENIIKLTV